MIVRSSTQRPHAVLLRALYDRCSTGFQAARVSALLWLYRKNGNNGEKQWAFW